MLMRGVRCSRTTWPGNTGTVGCLAPSDGTPALDSRRATGMPHRKRSTDAPARDEHPSVAPLYIVGDPEDLDTDQAILATMHEILVVMRQGIEELRTHGDRLAAIEGTMRRNTEVTEKYIAKRLGWKGEKRDRP